MATRAHAMFGWTSLPVTINLLCKEVNHCYSSPSNPVCVREARGALWQISMLHAQLSFFSCFTHKVLFSDRSLPFFTLRFFTILFILSPCVRNDGLSTINKILVDKLSVEAGLVEAGLQQFEAGLVIRVFGYQPLLITVTQVTQWRSSSLS